MITTFFNKADLEYACSLIRRKGEEPILYTSMENAAELVSTTLFENWDNDTNIDQKAYEGNDGFIGTYYGCYVYATDEVGDLWVIVPRCKENMKNE